MKTRITRESWAKWEEACKPQKEEWGDELRDIWTQAGPLGANTRGLYEQLRMSQQIWAIDNPDPQPALNFESLFAAAYDLTWARGIAQG